MWSFLRVRFKTWLARHMLVIEFCHDCGLEQPLVWTAETELWEFVAQQPYGGGVLCPMCFDRRAVRLGLFLRWVPVAEPRI